MVNGGYDHAWSIFDANFEADNTASLEFGGGMFWDSFRAVGTTPADASASHAKTVKEGVENTPDYYKCADTIEELVEQLDVPADVALETIAHYNELCEAGEDTDFYKESHFLFPIKQAAETVLPVNTRHNSPQAFPELAPGRFGCQRSSVAGQWGRYGYPIDLRNEMA